MKDVVGDVERWRTTDRAIILGGDRANVGKDRANVETRDPANVEMRDPAKVGMHDRVIVGMHDPAIIGTVHRANDRASANDGTVDRANVESGTGIIGNDRANIENDRGNNANEPDRMNQRERMLGRGADVGGMDRRGVGRDAYLVDDDRANESERMNHPIQRSKQKAADRTTKRGVEDFSNIDGEWGFRILVSPCYSRATARELALEEGTAKKLKSLNEMVASFTLSQDVALIKMANELCAKDGADPLALSPAMLFPLDHIKWAELENKLPAELIGVGQVRLGLRFVILRNFNRRLAKSLPLIDLSQSDEESRLAAKIRSLRSIVFTQVKRTLFERVLQDSHSGDGASMQREKSPTVVLDRSSTATFSETSGGDNQDMKQKLGVFGQLFSQLYRRVPLPQLRNSERAFYAILAGEHSDDYGGPYRDVLNQACDELMSSGTLFCMCPTKRHVPNPRAVSATAIEMLEFVGVLIGISMRTKTPLSFDMPAFVWKRICAERVVFGDLRACDPSFCELVDALAKISNVSQSEWIATLANLNLDLRFSVIGIDGRVIDLVPGGRDLAVTYETRGAFLSLAVKRRMEETSLQCVAMVRGMATQVPRHLLSLFTWQEIEAMCCGPEIIDVEVLKKCTIYGDGIDESSAVVNYFWQTLETFDESDKRKYLRFVWGRTRLPLSVNEWDRKHKINLLRVGGEDEDQDPDDYLPVGHTCFFSVDLPNYTSMQVCKDKVFYAITHCVTIDADETTNARRNAEQDLTGVARVDESQEDLGF